MSSDVAIRVEGLGKAYTIRHQQSDHVTLAQVALERAKHPFQRNEREQFWALQDVSFEVKQGEVLGVIGRNGAGKSTLLKLLTRITGPTAGRIDLWGRVGLVAGGGHRLPPRAHRPGERLPERVDPGHEPQGDRPPVRRHRRLRRRREVPRHPGEALLERHVRAARLRRGRAPGDRDPAGRRGARRRRRRSSRRSASGKMHDVAVDGRTVLFVSHQIASITQLCDRAILLEDGGLAFEGPVPDAAEAYNESFREGGNLGGSFGTRHGIDRGTRVRFSDAHVELGPNEDPNPQALRYSVEIESFEEASDLVLSHSLRHVGGSKLGSGFVRPSISLGAGTRTQATIDLALPFLAPGSYLLSVAIGRGDETGVREFLDIVEDVLAFDVQREVAEDGATDQWHESWGAIRLPAGTASIRVTSPPIEVPT